MILMLHIVIAVSSLLHASYLYFVPSQKQLRLSYGLVGATLVSGTWLVATAPAHLATACVSGLAYLTVVSAGLALARRKLALQAD